MKGEVKPKKLRKKKWEKEDETDKQGDLKLCLNLLADTLLGKETGMDLQNFMEVFLFPI